MNQSPLTLPRGPEEARYDREPPFSTEAEAAVLGGILIDEQAMVRVADQLDESMFHREAHRRLFRSMARLFAQNRAIDPITVSEDLKTVGELDDIGGWDYLSSLLDAVPTAANIEYHAGIVHEKALLRRLIDACQENVRDAYDPGDRPVGELLDTAEQRIFAVSQTQNRGGFIWIKEVLWPTFQKIDELQEKGQEVSGLATGFRDLDLMTTGFQPGDLAVVAGRPAMGKTSWVLNVAQTVAIQYGIPVGIFSLEMSKEQLVVRFLCAEGRVNAQQLRRAKLQPDDFRELARAASRINTAPIWIDDSATGTVLEMKAKARRLKAEAQDLGLIIVDYMQLMSGGARKENRVQEVSEISRGLKALARELDLPVIALSQLSRAPEQRTDRRPQLSDLRESGSIEQDADLVMFLYRPEYYQGPIDKDGNSLEGKAELIVAKQRNGPTGTVELFFRKDFTLFESVMHSEAPEGTT